MDGCKRSTLRVEVHFHLRFVLATAAKTSFNFGTCEYLMKNTKKLFGTKTETRKVPKLNGAEYRMPMKPPEAIRYFLANST